VINYEEFCTPDIHGIKNKQQSFKTFEYEINKHFQLKETAPTDRDSRRCGLLGYKLGMTHYWNKWGQTVPCTVL
jgi:hypothetical protein